MYKLCVVPELLAQTLLPSENCYDMDLAILVVYNPMEFIFSRGACIDGVILCDFYNKIYSHFVDSVDALIRLVIWTVRSPCWNCQAAWSHFCSIGKVSHVIDIIAADSPTSQESSTSDGFSLVLVSSLEVYKLCRCFFEKSPPNDEAFWTWNK